MSFLAQTNYPPVDMVAPDSDFVTVCPGCTRLLVQVSNQPVYVTFGHGPAGAVVWETYPEPILPSLGQIARQFDAFKVRAYTKAAQLPQGTLQAQVKLTPLQ